MLLLSALLYCSALVAAAPQVLNKKDLALTPGKRLSVTEVLAYQATKAQCWTDSHLVWPMNDMPGPIKDGTEAKQLKLFTVEASSQQKLTVVNYCKYDIHYQHVGHGPGVLQEGDLKANGGTWSTPTSVGSNFKASRLGDPTKVVQVEYVVPKDDPKTLWYNLSLIDCLAKKNKLPTKDASGCVGLEAGLQFGNIENKSFQCAPGTWCDDQAYFYFENMCKNTNPVATCDSKYGITMEFCAANKANKKQT